MEEKTLLKIGVMVSLVGLVLLYFISKNAQLPDFNGNEIKDYSGKNVRLLGKVEDIEQNEKFAIIRLKGLKHGEKVSAVIFKKNNHSINLTQGQNIEITGEIRQFNGKMEIIVDRIKIFK